jgi:membrane-associated phospholipid phosphatase
MHPPTPAPRKRLAIPFILIGLLALGVILGSFLLDAPATRIVLAGNQGHWSTSAIVGALSCYGDWPELMILGALGYFLARRIGNVRWQRLLLSAMIASTLAGMTVNASRLTSGRTRPRATADQGWYGPRHDGRWLVGEADFNSFPSGHTATAMGFAGVLLFGAPAWGIPAMIIAAAIAISRILLGAHHPSDVITAATIALVVAWLVWEFLGRRGRVDHVVRGPVREVE